MNRKIIFYICLVLVSLFIINITNTINAEYSEDGKVPIWQRNIGNKVHSISISGDGEYITATNDQGELFLFSKDSDIELWKFSIESGNLNAKISKNSEYIVARSGRNIFYFSKDSNTYQWKKQMSNDINSYSICDDGRFVLVAMGKNATLITGNTGDIIRDYDIGDTIHGKAKISGDGNYIIATDGEIIHLSSSEIYFYSTNSSTLLWKDSIRGGYLDVLISYDAEYILITQGYWSSDTDYWGNRISGYHGNAYLYVKNGTKIWSKDVKAVTSWAITDDGNYIVIGGRDPLKLYFLKKSSNEPIWTNNYQHYIGISSISDDANIIVVGSDKGIIDVYDKSGKILWNRTVSEMKDGIFSDVIGKAKVSSNGKNIVIGTTEGTVLLFDIIVPPKINAGDDQKISKGDKVTFTGTATDDSSKIVKYEWDFDGDGTYDYSSTELDSNASYTYKEKGEYTVRFKATNEKGASSIDTLVVKVSEKDGESTPGFEFLILIISCLAVVGLLNWRKK